MGCPFSKRLRIICETLGLLVKGEKEIFVFQFYKSGETEIFAAD
jgi:hypothetical protein